MSLRKDDAYYVLVSCQEPNNKGNVCVFNKSYHHIYSPTDGQVDLQTLVTLISSKVTTPAPERAEDLIEIFRMYDKDGRGTVRVQEMHHLLTTVGEKLTDEEAENLLKMSGCVSNGLVDYQSTYPLFVRHSQSLSLFKLL